MGNNDNNEKSCEFEDLDTYLRIYIFKHIGKSKCSLIY